MSKEKKSKEVRNNPSKAISMPSPFLSFFFAERSLNRGASVIFFFSFFASLPPLPSAAEKRRATKKLARAASASVRRPVVNIHRRVGGRMTNDLNLHPNFIPRYRVIGSHSLPNWMRRRWVAPAILVEILFGGKIRGERGGDTSPRDPSLSPVCHPIRSPLVTRYTLQNCVFCLVKRKSRLRAG